MAFRWMTYEWAARLLVVAVVLGVPIATLAARWSAREEAVVVQASMPEEGGWAPDSLTAQVGEPLQLRLTSTDVLHGFAVGQREETAVDVHPGQMTEVTLLFDQPGTYTYYCTRWCGPNHWRMRGTIEVRGQTANNQPAEQPLYLKLAIDLDSPPQVEITPVRPPSARRGEMLDVNLPPAFTNIDTYRAHSPYEVWRSLREESLMSGMSEGDVWDLVALIWWRTTSAEALQTGADLYAQNCAACHGETGQGDGVMAAKPPGENLHTDKPNEEFGHEIVNPPDFTSPEHMLGVSPARLQGKILRGGMGTGMPYWGPIFTEEQTWSLVDYLWTFQYEAGDPGR